MKKTKKGFSLVELLVVMIILSLIVSALAPIITRKLAANGIVIGSLGTGNEGEEDDGKEEPNYVTRTPQSQADCDPYKAKYFKGTCITKANAGDTTYGGPPIDGIADIERKSAGQKCTTSVCCHKGDTAGIGTTFSTSSYSGKSRTLCTWEAAKIACDNYDINNTKGQWRLPTSAELQEWKNSTENNDFASSVSALTKFLGKNGLDLCDGNSSVPHYHHGSAQCTSKSGGCPNSKASGASCHPERVWGEEATTANAYYGNLTSGQISVSTLAKTNTGSVRCVLDQVSAKEIRPHTEDPTSYETPASQADCDPYNAKYFNGTCITKGNIGDTANQGIPIASKGTPSADSFTDYGIEVLSPGKKCTTNTCCWMGKTSGSCSVFDATDVPYSGCNRTVCTWYAADVACKNYNINNTKGLWELPSQEDLIAWKIQFTNDTSSAISLLSRYLGNDGIDLCDNNGSTPELKYGSSKCASLSGSCPTPSNDSLSCHPYAVWGEPTAISTNCKQAYAVSLNSGELSAPSAIDKYSAAHSSRCVLKKIKKRVNTTPQEDTRTFKTPASQADCTPYKAIYFNNTCITKGNVGDTDRGGAPITKNIGGSVSQGNITDLKIVALATGAKCTTNTCCWYGHTSNTCSTYSIAGSYDGCTRTTCTWYAADIACRNYNINNTKGLWRLPTKEEFEKLKTKIQAETTNNSTNINNFQGRNGLDLCEGTTSAATAAARGRALCRGGEVKAPTTYPTDHSNQSMALWGETTNMAATTKTAYTFGIGIDTTNAITINSTREKNQGALSARCVLNKIPLN